MSILRNHYGFITTFTLLLAASGCSGRHGPTSAEEEGESQASVREAEEGREEDRGARRALTVKGSDTMVILAQRWAEAFMEKNEGAVIQVSGGGSGTGIAALINGTTDVANASRQMKERERAQLREARNGAEAKETRVALDALAVYVQADNPIESLTVPELAKIFRGQVTNWSEVGGPDRPIVLYSRENNSGTYAYFKEHVLDDMDFAATAQTLPGTAAVINAISRDPNGIGYGGIAYAEGVRSIPISREDEEPVEPTMENATSGRYPLARYLHVYTAGEPAGLAEEYIEFILSDDGQSIVEGVGYYPLPEESAEEEIEEAATEAENDDEEAPSADDTAEAADEEERPAGEAEPATEASES